MEFLRRVVEVLPESACTLGTMSYCPRALSLVGLAAPACLIIRSLRHMLRNVESNVKTESKKCSGVIAIDNSALQTYLRRTC